MEDAQTIIVLLTIIAALLSIVILVLLGTVISLLIKINAIMKKVDKITMNVASATDNNIFCTLYGIGLRFGRQAFQLLHPKLHPQKSPDHRAF